MKNGTRVALFINGKTFYAGWRETTQGLRVDFPAMAHWIVKQAGGKTLVGAHYYTSVIETQEAAEDPSSQGLRKFLEMLENQAGFFVHVSRRKIAISTCEHCHEESTFTSDKELDLELTAHMLQQAFADAYDTAVLVTGDGDYTPVIRRLRTMGKQIHVAGWGVSGMSKRLRGEAFSHIDLLAGMTSFDQDAAIEHMQARVGPTEILPFTGEHRFDAFLSEIILAKEKFRGGFVGADYFLNRWRSANLDDTYGERRRVMDDLMSAGWVETYDVGDGRFGVRFTDRGEERLRELQQKGSEDQ
ncbi:MAG: NYN domain-containing protein [Myxococcota bacterium]